VRKARNRSESFAEIVPGDPAFSIKNQQLKINNCRRTGSPKPEARSLVSALH
jgi:hypothetical protein